MGFMARLFMIVWLTAQATGTWAHETYSVGSACFSPDGKLLAALEKDCSVGVWDVASGNKVRSLYKSSGGCRPLEQMIQSQTPWKTHVSFSPDGKLLVAQLKGASYAIDLWRIADGTKVASLVPPELVGTVDTIEFSPDSRLMIAVGEYPVNKRSSWNTITVWDITTFKALFQDREPRHLKFKKVALSPDGKSVVAVVGRQEIGREREDVIKIRHLDHQAYGARAATAKMNGSDATFSPDGRFLIVKSGEGAGHVLWDVQASAVRPTVETDRTIRPREVASPPAPVISANNVAEPVGDDKWNWTVFLKVKPEDLDKVECVEYTLHPTFPDPVRRVCEVGDPKKPFGLSASGWGTFDIGIRVLMKDGNVQELTHTLKF
jgi:hypothetical protein